LPNDERTIVVKNNLDFVRREVVSITGIQLSVLVKENNEKDLRITKEGAKE